MLEHEVVSISSQLSEIRNAFGGKDQGTGASSFTSPKLNALESISLIHYTPEQPSRKDTTLSKTCTCQGTLQDLERVFQLVKVKVGLTNKDEVCDYVKSCIKFT